MKPRRQSGCSMRELRAALIRSSGTSPPAAMIDCVSSPSGVPAAISARSMSPVEMEGMALPCHSFSHSMMSRPCVPLPQPGGPKRRIIKDDCIVPLQIDDNKVCHHKTETRPATEDYERKSWRAVSAGARCRRRC